MKKVIVLDWDGVLFDDDRYRSVFFTMLQRFGSHEEIEKLYQSSKDGNGYNDRRLAQAVSERFGVDAQSIQAQMDVVMERTESEFIFGDARAFVTDPRNDTPLIVLSAGDQRLQTQKIEKSGLAPYFDQVIIVPADKTEHNKEERLEQLLQTFDSVVFFDDRRSTISHLRKLYPDRSKLLPVLVDRSASSDDQSTVTRLTLDWIRTHTNIT